MERGVAVGGLMICGSFLLAAVLNRSAMEEVSTPDAPAGTAPVVPGPVAAPLAPDIQRPAELNESASRCATSDAAADPSSSNEQADEAGADPAGNDLPVKTMDDLPVNGIPACQQ